uniref:Oligopeptidase B n=1 Tax=Rhizophora mucronata TaxID=61149 RepID=A0A2P2KHY6_RHIMU
MQKIGYENKWLDEDISKFNYWKVWEGATFARLE